jgi:hypothetical protein
MIEFLPEDIVLHKYTCECGRDVITMLPPASCIHCGSTVFSISDTAYSIHMTELGSMKQYDSIDTLDVWIDEEAEREDLDKSTRNVEKLRRGIGVEDDGYTGDRQE